MKKRILIVDCNAKIGGIQKSLVTLLRQISDLHDVTLLLLYHKGELLQEIPDNVRVLETRSHFKYMGMAQKDCVGIGERLLRGLYVLISRIAGRKMAVRLAKTTLRKDRPEEYDIAVAYSHMAGAHSFYAGAPEYVLHAVNARKKVCYIHCDYLESGNRSSYSDAVYRQFDAIACVSESTKMRFIQAIPELGERTFLARNPIDHAYIHQQAADNPVCYDDAHVHFVSVARLSAEKGIARFVRILSCIDSEKVRYWIVGDGQERAGIERLIAENHLEQMVKLCGEVSNPYRYMANADLLVVPSYHEAAPVVFQEARVLNLPVLTTRTASADEMVGTFWGFVAENEDEAFAATLRRLLSQPELLHEKRKALRRAAGADVEMYEPELLNIIHELSEKQK